MYNLVREQQDEWQLCYLAAEVAAKAGSTLNKQTNKQTNKHSKNTSCTPTGALLSLSSL
jgi:hypothetical protein